VSGLTQTEQEFRSKLRSEFPWVRLFDIRLPDATHFRLARYDRVVEYTHTTAGVPLQWQPYDINFESIKRNDKGDVPELTLLISNASPQVVQTVNDNDLGGCKVRVMVVHVLQLHDPNAKVLDEVGRVVRAKVTVDGVAVTISGSNLYDIKYPARRFTRGFCTHVYGDDLCRADLTRSGMPAVCGRRIVDCTGVGDAEEALGLTRNHPRFFGGFPGIRRPSRSFRAGA